MSDWGVKEAWKDQKDEYIANYNRQLQEQKEQNEEEDEEDEEDEDEENGLKKEDEWSDWPDIDGNVKVDKEDNLGSWHFLFESESNCFRFGMTNTEKKNK